MNGVLRRVAAGLLISATCALGQDAPEPAPTPEEMARRLAELERLVQEQQRQLDALRAADPAPADPAPVTSAQTEKEKEHLLLQANLAGFELSASPGRGLTVTAPEERFQITLRARIQLRDTVFMDGDAETNEINVRTFRFFTQGYVFNPDVRYLVQLAFGSNDFETGNSSPLFDGFLEYTGWRDAHIRVGQYFVPFDRARTIREFALQFVDRQIVVRELTLDRDVGIMVHSQDLFGTKVLTYALFAGGGEGRNRFGGQEPGPLVIGRFGVRPFGPFDDDVEGDIKREDRLRVALGVAGGYNYRTNRAQSTFGTVSTAGTFDYHHAAADLVIKYGGFSLLVEGVYRHSDRNSRARVVNGVFLRNFSRNGHGYFVQAGFMVHQYVELVARWDQLFAEDRRTDPALVTLARQVGRQVGGGVNVYLNGHLFKVQTDYFYLFGTGDDSQKAHQVRVALDVSF